MENKLIILDECVSDLTDMLTSKLTAGRCKDGRDSRQVRLAQIEELLKNCHGIVALDAYLSDTEVDFLRGLKSFDFIHKIENTFQNQATVRFVAHKSTLTRAILDDALAGANLLVTATTQNHCENLEKALTRIGIPAGNICRIDSKTDRDEKIGLFFRNPKSYLETYHPQIVILSPTAESGISIDLKQLETYHYLLNPELAEINHLAVWLPVLETESTWLPDQLQRSSLTLVNVGRELGLDRLVARQVSKQQLEEIYEKVANSQLYQSALSLRINPNKQPNPIKICRRILKKFGLKLVKGAAALTLDGERSDPLSWWKGHTAKSGDNELFAVLPIADSTLSFANTPKYELLTPELCDRVRQLAGREFRTDDPEIQTLGMDMEAVGMHDGRGKMRLVAGSARHLGMSVATHRHRAIGIARI